MEEKEGGGRNHRSLGKSHPLLAAGVLMGTNHCSPARLSPHRCWVRVSTVQSEGLGVRAEYGIGEPSPECLGMPFS